VAALGSSVTLSCVCDSGLGHICPYCLGRQHLADMMHKYGLKSHNDLVDKPLFPSRLGTWCTKDGVISTIAGLATAAGHAPHNRRGAEKWGGHAFRRGGAHMYAALGLSREDIKAIARHTSSAIDAYLEGADLTYIKRLLPAKMGTLSSGFSAQPLEIPATFPEWAHVRMARSDKTHATQPSIGRTLCGWPWAASASRCVSSDTPVTCMKCLTSRRASSSAARVSSSSSSTSTP